MAKSKNGGTRAYIRGRIGSDVYSVGKNGKGARQQVVRSLAEQVSNPRTSSQMFGRMVMSTVMQAVSALKPIIDHSFDGLPTGQPSISEFIRLNYQLVKNDAIANPIADNSFGLNKYQEKGIKGGAFQISKGDVAAPLGVSMSSNFIVIDLSDTTLTVGGLKSVLGLSADGYLTGVCIKPSVGAQYARIKLATNLSDATAITSGNVGSLFSVESNVAVTVSLYQNSVSIKLGDDEQTQGSGLIVSEMVAGAWKHSTCVLGGVDNPQFASNAALPTYPTGAEQFLNGGDL